MLNFYQRQKDERFDSLKTIVEKSWPSAYNLNNYYIHEQNEGLEKKSSNGKNDIYTIVDEMPLFPGCDIQTDDFLKKKTCADKKLLKYLYSHIKYPEIARKREIEGQAIIEFTVSEHGTIVNSKILENPGGATGEEDLRLVNKMIELPYRWIPGKHKNQLVRVIYSLPVRYKLN